MRSQSPYQGPLSLRPGATAAGRNLVAGFSVGKDLSLAGCMETLTGAGHSLIALSPVWCLECHQLGVHP